MPQHNSIRNRIILLIKNGNFSTKFSRKRPNEWRPERVRNPSGTFFSEFTEESAWELIMELLEKGHPIEPITLKKPPGAKGYVMKVELEPNTPKLYIKLELGNIVFGRSFHYSDWS